MSWAINVKELLWLGIEDSELMEATKDTMELCLQA